MGDRRAFWSLALGESDFSLLERIGRLLAPTSVVGCLVFASSSLTVALSWVFGSLRPAWLILLGAAAFGSVVVAQYCMGSGPPYLARTARSVALGVLFAAAWYGVVWLADMAAGSMAVVYAVVLLYPVVLTVGLVWFATRLRSVGRGALLGAVIIAAGLAALVFSAVALSDLSGRALTGRVVEVLLVLVGRGGPWGPSALGTWASLPALFVPPFALGCAVGLVWMRGQSPRHRGAGHPSNQSIQQTSPRRDQ